MAFLLDKIRAPGHDGDTSRARFGGDMRSKSLQLNSITFFFVLVLIVDRGRAGPADNWEATREQQRADNEAMLGNIPLLDKTHVQDVFQLRVENRALTVRTPLATTRASGYVRCKLDGMSQFALVRVLGGSDSESGQTVIPANLQFNLTDYSRPGQIAMLTVTAQVTLLTISRSLQFPNGQVHVQLMEQCGQDGTGQSASITLAVNESTPSAGPPVNLSLEADDFFAFIHNYPDESEKYVRPLLREVGQEAVFAPDPMIAWQVFSDSWQAPAETLRKVNFLLPQLDSQDFRQRRAASQSLQSLGRDGAAVLVHLNRSRLSAEQNVRIDRLLAPYAQLPAGEAMGLRSQVGFLLDCLYCDDVLLRRAALKRVREVSERDVAFDVEADSAARAVAVAGLRHSLLPAMTK